MWGTQQNLCTLKNVPLTTNNYYLMNNPTAAKNGIDAAVLCTVGNFQTTVTYNY